MKRAWIGVGVLVGFFLLAMFLLADAEAQTAVPAPDAGAFDRLSPGEQKIAQAIFEAQGTPTATGAAKPLSLDDIAAMKQGGRGWGVIFKDMKQRGLVTDKNLGQAVSRYNHEHRVSSSGSGTQITTASGRTWVIGGAHGGPGSQGGQAKSVRGEDGDRGGVSTAAGGQADASGHGGGASAGHGGSSGGRGK